MFFKRTLSILGIVLGTGIVFGLILLLNLQPKLDSEINLFWWGNETHPPGVREGFEKEFGVKVNVPDFGGEGKMAETLKAGNTDYDIVGVTDIYINELISSGLVAPINIRNVPNARNLIEQCSDRSYNSENFYMVPIMWLTNGLIFNTKYIPEDTDSWGVFWNPEYANRIALDDTRNNVFQVALQYIGYPVFAQDRFQILEAKKFLLKQKPLLRGYENQFLLGEGLISGELWAAHVSSAQAGIAIAGNPDLKYVIPKEGSAFVPLGFAIPITSKKKYTAEVFINYFLRAENNAATAYFASVAPCSNAAQDFLSSEFLSNSVVYPSEEELERVDSSANYETPYELKVEMEKIWTELNGPEVSI